MFVRTEAYSSYSSTSLFISICGKKKKKSSFEIPEDTQPEEPSHQSAGGNCKLALCVAISSALRAPVSSWV